MTRSFLYVPGDSPEKLTKAPGRGADALIMDLEDSVVPARKDLACQAVAAAVGPAAGAGQQVWVRVNSQRVSHDIAEVCQTGLAGIVVAVAVPDLVREADAALTAAETRLGLVPGSVALLPLIESAQGLLDAPVMARMRRVARLGLGEVDLAADLGVSPSEAGVELAPARLQTVVASAAAGLPGPAGPVPLRLDDPDGLRRSTRALMALGFRARTAVHPKQIATINEVFTPSPQEIADARDMLAAFDTARAAGTGAMVGPDGTMVDLAVVRAAADVLARAGRPPG